MPSIANRPIIATATAVAASLITAPLVFAASASAATPTASTTATQCTKNVLVKTSQGGRNVAVCIHLSASNDTGQVAATVEARIGQTRSRVPVTVTATGSLRAVKQTRSTTTTSYGTQHGVTGKPSLVLAATKTVPSRHTMYATEKVTLRWPSGTSKTVTITSPGASVGD